MRPKPRKTAARGAPRARARSSTRAARALTYKRNGALVRATGPIACTRAERIEITVPVRQPATAARAQSRWNDRCTGEVQHWQVAARLRRGTRFENGRGRVCAVATARRRSRVIDTRRWCERVDLVEVLRTPEEDG